MLSNFEREAALKDSAFCWLARHDIWFSISNTCGGVWSNGVGRKRENDEEHDEDCVEETFQLDSVKLDRDGEKDREVLGTGFCSINIWDGSKLELALSKKSSSYFENVFLILLLSFISNTSTFKLRGVNFLVMKIFPNIFRRTFCFGR